MDGDDAAPAATGDSSTDALGVVTDDDVPPIERGDGECPRANASPTPMRNKVTTAAPAMAAWARPWMCNPDARNPTFVAVGVSSEGPGDGTGGNGCTIPMGGGGATGCGLGAGQADVFPRGGGGARKAPDLSPVGAHGGTRGSGRAGPAGVKASIWSYPTTSPRMTKDVG